MRDWLAAVDDGLRGLPHYCMQCGAQEGRGWFDIVEAGTIAVAVVICSTCKAGDSQRQALVALLARRYTPNERKDADDH